MAKKSNTDKTRFRQIDGRPVPISVPRFEIWAALDEGAPFSRKSVHRCGRDAYFVRHNGGSVWFDELGQPWPKHECSYYPDPYEPHETEAATWAATLGAGELCVVVASTPRTEGFALIKLQGSDGIERMGLLRGDVRKATPLGSLAVVRDARAIELPGPNRLGVVLPENGEAWPAAAPEALLKGEGVFWCRAKGFGVFGLRPRRLSSREWDCRFGMLFLAHSGDPLTLSPQLADLLDLRQMPASGA